MVLLHDMAVSPEWKRDGRNKPTSGRRTESHFSQSGFESTEWKAAESSSHHCVCCTDPFDFAHNGGGENRRPLDRCVPDRPVVTD